MKPDILIVDDESDIRAQVRGILEDEGYQTRTAANSDQAFQEIEKKAPDLAILDIWLQNSDHDGLTILKSLKEKHPEAHVLMMSGHGNIETAVSAIKQGAYDFIEKPFKSDRLLLLIERVLETARLKRENKSLRQKAEGPNDLLGESQIMASLRQMLGKVAQTNSRVLLTGEPGTGKDIAARIIHKMSRRSEGPFVVLNCALLRADQLEAELFGVVGGGSGVLEKANGGTIFLDEVADMPLETQGKIVRVLQEQKFHRIGGHEPVETDVRVIAATNRNLVELIASGVFREDLYYRLNVVPVRMPPLREHPEDIRPLTDYFGGLFSTHSGIPRCVFSDSALALMQAYDWPGNVRQLRNAIEWIMIMSGGGNAVPVRPEHLPPEIAPLSLGENGGSLENREAIAMPLREARELFERDYLLSQIRRFGGNISRTAEFVGMERSALHRKLKQLGVSEALRKEDREEGDDSLADESRKIA